MIAIVILVIGALVTQGHATCEEAASAFSAAEQQKIVDKHNAYRGSASPAASGMAKLTWSESLAKRAQAWADKCSWDHGMSADCNGVGMGQNLHGTSGTMDGEAGVTGWWNENQWYTHSTNTCTPPPKKSCGHYTQVLWGATSTVGCGWANCVSTTGMNHMVCNYQPAGNVNMGTEGTLIYATGAACSACAVASGGYKCENNLCVACTPSTDTGCTCPFTSCENGGTFNSGDCSCTCVEPYYSAKCELKCEDKGSGGCASWKVSGFCTNSMYKAFMATTCPKACGFC